MWLICPAELIWWDFILIYKVYNEIFICHLKKPGLNKLDNFDEWRTFWRLSISQGSKPSCIDLCASSESEKMNFISVLLLAFSDAKNSTERDLWRIEEDLIKTLLNPRKYNRLVRPARSMFLLKKFNFCLKFFINQSSRRSFPILIC